MEKSVNGKMGSHWQGGFDRCLPGGESKLGHSGWSSVSRGWKIESVKPRVSEATVKTGLFPSEAEPLEGFKQEGDRVFMPVFCRKPP